MESNKIRSIVAVLAFALFAGAGSRAHALCGRFFRNAALDGGGPAWKGEFDRLKTFAFDGGAQEFEVFEAVSQTLWLSYYKGLAPPRKPGEAIHQLSAEAADLLERSGRTWSASNGDAVIRNTVAGGLVPYGSFAIRKKGLGAGAYYVYERATGGDRIRLRRDFIDRATLFLHHAGDKQIDYFAGKRDFYFAEIAYRYLLLAPSEAFAIDFLQALHVSATGRTYRLRSGLFDRAIAFQQLYFVRNLAEEQSY